jgi:DNA-binding MurR/RpiR family transcriptional regulator
VDGTSDRPVREGLRSRIRAALDSFHPAELRVGQIVLDQPNRVVHLPISELAGLAGVSEGTVIRFSVSVGCQGYQGLKLELAADLSQPMLAIHEDITPADKGNPSAVAQKVFAADILALQDTLKLQDPTTLLAAVEAMDRASDVVFFAVGSSQAIATDAAGRIVRIGRRAQAPQDAHQQVVAASLILPDAVAVAISHSGASLEPEECLSLAKLRGATTIAITARHPSPLTTHADIVLLTMSAETRYREEALASRIAQLSLLDSLYVSLALRHPASSVEAMKATSEALASHRVRAPENARLSSAAVRPRPAGSSRRVAARH